MKGARTVSDIDIQEISSVKIDLSMYFVSE